MSRMPNANDDDDAITGIDTPAWKDSSCNPTTTEKLGGENPVRSLSDGNDDDASKWDLHELYEYSVQSPKPDVDFLEQVYKNRYGKSPKCIREDFCGTAAMSVEWVRRSTSNYAIGIDWDLPTLEWGKRRHVETKLDKAGQDRIWLVHGDVLDGVPFESDLIVAQNFSWMLLRDREVLRKYLVQCKAGLRPEGVLTLDIFGGPDSQRPCHETKYYPEKGFTYHWIQESYDPINNHVKCGIHFSFDKEQEMNKKDKLFQQSKQEQEDEEISSSTELGGVACVEDTNGPASSGDGADMIVETAGNDEEERTIYRAFSYDFRFYSIPEVVELLKVGANFPRVQVYWERKEKLTTSVPPAAAASGHHPQQGHSSSSSTCYTTSYYPVTTAEHESSWVAYIAAYNS